MKRSGTERILVAVSSRGTAFVMATDGPIGAYDAEELGEREADIGIGGFDGKPPGLYLWTGTIEYGSGGAPSGDDFYTTYRGTVRAVEPGEVAELFAMEAPETCPVCGKEATTEYEGEPSCGAAKCELAMQAGADYHAEAGDR